MTRGTTVFITGATGFIGRRVAPLFLGSGYHITALTRQTDVSFLQGAETVSRIEDCKAADYIVHIAHDHFDGRANKHLWEKLEVLADRAGSKGIVLFSSVAVHAPEFMGILTEADPYSRHGDDYVATKIWLEKRVQAWAARKPNASVWILRPTIVIGQGGNWTNHGLDVAAKKQAYLPFAGENPCCAIHVNDVAEAACAALKSLPEFRGTRSSLVSGSTPLPWAEFYKIHAKLYEAKTGKNSTLNIDYINDSRKYHSSKLKNISYKILFDSIFSASLRPLLGYARKLVRERRARVGVEMERPANDSWTPQGMSRVFHSSQFTVRSNLPDWAPNIPITGSIWTDHNR